MREPERIDRMIEKLRLAWHNNPDQRLCQLIWNIANRADKQTLPKSDIFYFEDDDFEIELNRVFGKSTKEMEKKP